MRPRLLLPLLLPVALSCSGGEPSPTEIKPEFVPACTPPKPTVTASPTSVSKPASSTGSAKFIVKNNCTVNVNGLTFQSSRTGAVATVGAPSPALVNSIAPGASVAVFVSYTTGAPGTGTVVLTSTTDPGAVSTGAQAVSVTAPVAAGIPFGLFGIKPDSIPNGTIWTGASLTSKNFNAIVTQLAAAKAKNPRIRMWFNMTAGDEQVFMNPTTGAFMLQAWKDTLDNHAKPFNADGTSSFYDNFLPYIQDGTFQGHQMLDDLAAFTPDPTQAQIDSMAAYSKKRFPLLPTAVRARPTQLKSWAPVCSTCPGGRKPYGVLDMGWAQYHGRVGDPTVYRDAEIAAAKDMQLGMLIGINIRKGLPPDDSPVPPDSILKWGNIFLEPGSTKSDYVCGFLMWDVAYQGLGNAVFSTLANKAASHVTAPCKRR
ncbi:MAG TPA: hypothetical protein VFB61_15115 [Gemmatimonadales bacterium]|nr:hypothetical protein [Gemmatimonadales bacterium]